MSNETNLVNFLLEKSNICRNWHDIWPNIYNLYTNIGKSNNLTPNLSTFIYIYVWVCHLDILLIFIVGTFIEFLSFFIYYFYRYNGAVAGVVIGSSISAIIITVIIVICIKHDNKTSGIRGHVIHPHLKTISTSITCKVICLYFIDRKYLLCKRVNEKRHVTFVYEVKDKRHKIKKKTIKRSICFISKFIFFFG